MNLKKLSKEELETLSYTDLTEMILIEQNKPMNTPSIFRIICDLLEYSESEYTNKIGDYYTSLTTDKRFYFLDETAEWDLRKNHSVKIVLDDDDDEVVLDEEEEEIEEEIEEELDDIDTAIESDELDDDDDDLDDLSVLTDEEIEEEN